MKQAYRVIVPEGKLEQDYKNLALLTIIVEYNLFLHRSKLIFKRPILSLSFVKFFSETHRTFDDFDANKDKLFRSALNDLLPVDNDFILLHDSRDNMVGYTCHTPDNKIYICFRGSNTKLDWMGNLLSTAVFSKHDKTLKHVEISAFAHRLFPTILSFIQSHQNIQSIQLIGHSRGSTLAFYTSLELSHSFPKTPIDLHLYAPPPFIYSVPRLLEPTFHVRNIFHEKDIVYRMHKNSPVSVGSVTNEIIVLPNQHSSVPVHYLRDDKPYLTIFTGHRQLGTKRVVHKLYDYYLTVVSLMQDTGSLPLPE